VDIKNIVDTGEYIIAGAVDTGDHTGKIENKIFLIQFIRKFRRDRLQSHILLTASSYMIKYLRLSSYIRKPFLKYDSATDPI
jgi:hypothetical protein